VVCAQEVLGRRASTASVRSSVRAVTLLGRDAAAHRPICLSFQHAPDHQPPRWPDPAFPQQFHIDVMVDDMDEAETKVLALGATRLPGEGSTFRVYADPAGHPFCLCTE